MQSHLSYLDHILTQQTLALMAFDGMRSKDEIEEWSKGEVERAFREVVNDATDQHKVIRIPHRGNVIAGVRGRAGEQSFVEVTSWSFLPPRNRGELLEVIALVRGAFSLRNVCAFLPYAWAEECFGVMGQKSAGGDESFGVVFCSAELSIERIQHRDRYSFL